MAIGTGVRGCYRKENGVAVGSICKLEEHVWRDQRGGSPGAHVHFSLLPASHEKDFDEASKAITSHEYT